jgi:hypothetical protein
VAADPVDVPGDIQRLAEAIDLDLANLTANIPLRPALRLRNPQPVVATTDNAAAFPDFTFDFTIEDFNSGVDYVQDVTNIFVGPQQRRITINTPGKYLVVGTVGIPRPTAGAARTNLGLRLRNGSSAAVLARTGNAIAVSASDGLRTMSLATMVTVAGGGSLFMIGFNSRNATEPPPADTYTLAERTITFVRMTPN